MEKEQLIALVKESQSGDAEAIEKLLQYAHTSVSYQCRKMLNNEQDAEDMTQEVLVTIYTKLDTLQDPAAFWKWANRITASRCINALNRTHVEYQFAEDEEGHSILDNLEELDEQVIPDKAIDNAETARMIEEIVTGLPDAQRAATLMFYYNEMSVKEIAQTMQVSENTVKSRLNYARKAIKEKVLDYEKHGVKLYGLSPLPFLLYFLRLAAQNNADKDAAGVMVAEVMAVEGAAAGIAGASAAGAGSAAAAVGGSIATTATAAATTAVATTTATGIFAGISVKVVAGVLAAVVTVSSVVAVAIPNTQADISEPATTQTEVTSVIETESLLETEAPTAEAVTEPSETETTQAPTEDTASTEPPASGDCPSCGIGSITVVMLSAPTCTTRGEAAGQCDHCGYVAGYSYPPANGHSMVETERVDSTCESTGYYILSCTECDHEEYYVLAAHNYIEIDRYGYDCVGYDVFYQCTDCEDIREEEEAGNGHDMVRADDYPPCGLCNFYDYVCTKCGRYEREHVDPIYPEHELDETNTCIHCGRTFIG